MTVIGPEPVIDLGVVPGHYPTVDITDTGWACTCGVTGRDLRDIPRHMATHRVTRSGDGDH